MAAGTGSFQDLVDIVRRLRSPGGCPWDREQTHATLKRNLLEEVHEALEAIDLGDHGKLAEEMGDVLVQVVFHAQMADEAGHFDIEDVVARITDKLVRRHPHVFGDAVAADAREVERNWEQIKQREGVRKSPVDGIPSELPALAHAQLMQDRVSKAGFEWEDVSGVLDKVEEEARELMDAPDPEARADELGDLLYTIVNLARWLNVHAEDSLRRTNARFRRRYLAMESIAADGGLDFPSLPLEDKERLWQQAKLNEKQNA